VCYLLGAIALFSTLSATPVWSEVVVPYEWITPGAYAKYNGNTDFSLFYPNHTSVFFLSGISSLLQWTVVDRTGDSVKLNVTFVAEGTAMIWHKESVPDGKINILDITTVAMAFNGRVCEWGFDPNADVTGPEGAPDQKVNILDISFVAVAFGSSLGELSYNLEADIAPEETMEEYRYHLHRKTLLLDVDVYSRESFLDGEPLGKTCFWAEPYADVGDTVALYGLPREEIVGNVSELEEDWYGWSGVTTYRVKVLQLDPFVWFDSHFDWHTGMAMEIYLFGKEPFNPEGEYWFDDTRITRFATTPLGIELNVGTAAPCELWLASTNVQIGPPT